MDKMVIKVAEAKEGLDPFYSVRGFPVVDYFNLFRVNLNSLYINNKPKVLYSFYFKLILLNINL